MQFTHLLTLAAGTHAAALPSIVTRQSSSSSAGLHTAVSLGDNHMDWGTSLPSDALTDALNTQCSSGLNQCDTEPYTYGTAVSVAHSYTPGGSGAYITESDNLVFTMAGNWANEDERQNLVAAMGAAIGAATANNSFYDVGSAGNPYLAATPGFEFDQYNAPTFLGVSIINPDSTGTDAFMNMNVQEVSADSGWCSSESSLFGAISSAVGAIPVVGGTASSIFGFISAACGS